MGVKYRHKKDHKKYVAGKGFIDEVIKYVPIIENVIKGASTISDHTKKAVDFIRSKKVLDKNKKDIDKIIGKIREINLSEGKGFNII